ncbi:monovalent cation/H(+) antiporter subunit G [Aureimonas sp. ME7]|uniref:monovalent cation/H(+) antiporter subunit G n=1 Tax=Aureimonas sp. ME7 TaxID=2744252 RepID=UPI0015F4FA6B|nr:monovalent cation/H(+) antiporter subunit G [Aureimonas sp. ME7]
MTAVGNLLASVFVILGAMFALVASVGILRLPDFYTRVHAASKAGTIGSALALVALAIVSVQTAEVLRAIAAIVFFFLTAPIAAHLLGKAAYSAGYRMWSGSVLDEMPDARRPETDDGDPNQRPIL